MKKNKLNTIYIYIVIEFLILNFPLSASTGNSSFSFVKYQNIIGILLFSIMVGALFLVYYLWKQRRIITIQNEQLKQMNEKRSQLFSVIAHDLRGPIISFQNISKRIEYLQENGKPKDVDKMLKMTDVAAKNLNTLLDNLLSWSLAEQDNYPNHPTEINLKNLCKDSVELFKPLAESKGVKLKQHAFADQIILADKTAVAIILRNLVNNAIKFSQQGDEVILKSKKIKGKVLLEVKDTGVGISPQIKEKLFTLSEDRIKRGTNGEKGTGLGLLLCKQLVEINNGNLSLETQVGKGTQVTISFPSI